MVLLLILILNSQSVYENKIFEFYIWKCSYYTCIKNITFPARDHFGRQWLYSLSSGHACMSKLCSSFQKVHRLKNTLYRHFEEGNSGSLPVKHYINYVSKDTNTTTDVILVSSFRSTFDLQVFFFKYKTNLFFWGESTIINQLTKTNNV